jgi:hypothetical protein
VEAATRRLDQTWAGAVGRLGRGGADSVEELREAPATEEEAAWWTRPCWAAGGLVAGRGAEGRWRGAVHEDRWSGAVGQTAHQGSTRGRVARVGGGAHGRRPSGVCGRPGASLKFERK